MKSGVYLSPDGTIIIYVETMYVEGSVIGFDSIKKIPLVGTVRFGEVWDDVVLVSDQAIINFSYYDWHYLGEL
jgi:hypothetical protein